MNLIQRVAAVEATIARFKDRPLAYGKDDCVRMTAFCLRKLGVRAPLLKAGTYSTPTGARRALKKLGFDTLEQAVDSLELPRIPPASAWPGDVIALEGSDGAALCIAVGNGRVLGFWEESGVCAVLQPHQYLAAWRSV